MMMALWRWSLWVGLVGSASAAGGEVPFPEGFRQWNHVKSMVIADGHPLVGAFGGVHHVYVNDVGLPALRSGGPLPDGTVLVFDLLEAPTAGGGTTEGARKLTATMVKNGAKYAATGGWGFEAFAGTGRDRVVTDGGAACFACHQPQAGSDFVYTRWRD